MSKYRIYELAKEFNTTSKVILDILARNNNDVAKNHMSSVGDTEKAIIVKTFSSKKVTENAAPKQVQINNNVRQNQPTTTHINKPNDNRSNNNNINDKKQPIAKPAVSHNTTSNNTQQKPNTINSGNSNNKPPMQNNRNNNFNNNRKPAFGQNRPNQKNKNHQNKNYQTPVKAAKPEVEKPKVIKLGESITVKELSMKMGREVTDIIKKLMMLGIMATINQEIDLDTATLIAGEFDVTVEELPPEEDPTEIPEIIDDPATLVLRPPVVTVMGHVDHGKTSLLDVIRKTQVTAKEAGGITQHIGAYQVVCQNKKIVFLDTPGHEAFTAMRARGAQVTDIAILVVAADDGVMPQTIEAINHAKSANVPIIVAINKMDRPGANPDHVKQQLSEHGLIPEDWGGTTIMVPVSARQQTGIKDLLEMILLVAEMQELKANPNRAAQGIIIEAQLDKGRGPVATVLVQTGTLHVGDSIIAGTAYGKVRAMINDRGEKVKKSGPSTPVEVLGLADVPEAGDILAALDEKQARSIAEKRIAKKRSDDLMHSQKVSLDDLFQQIQDGNIKDLNILIKADVQGSVEALKSSLLALNTNEEVRVNIIHSGVGAVNESDVMLATAANALIIAFNVRPDANARKLADTENIDIRTYRIIYEAINDVQAAMTGMLAPQFKEVIQGKVEIRQVLSFSKALVAGSYVLEGKVTNNSSIRIIRDDIVVYEGVIDSLRRFKDDVKEVAAGYECGITIDKYRDIKEGDIIEAYTMEQIKIGN
ncbi:MAG: translation initiation factor [Massilibacillus sp.]|nr:translation initiation factor [Massilibacillus sp.]